MNYKITFKIPRVIELPLTGNISSVNHLNELTRVISKKEGAPVEILSWEEIPENYSEAPETEVASTTPAHPEPPETIVPRIPQVAP